MEFGYCVFNNITPVEDFPLDMVQLVNVEASNEIILASDGYPELKNTLADSERWLKHVIEKDPLCYTLFKSTKGVMRGNNSFDDRTYVKLAVIS